MHRLFDRFRLDSAQRQLLRDDTPVKLERQAMSLLLALTQRPGVVLSHRELECTLWPDTLVDDSCLRAQVAALRKALGNPSYIANVPRRGYAFVATVRRSVPAELQAGAIPACPTLPPAAIVASTAHSHRQTPAPP